MVPLVVVVIGRVEERQLGSEGAQGLGNHLSKKICSFSSSIHSGLCSGSKDRRSKGGVIKEESEWFKECMNCTSHNDLNDSDTSVQYRS